MLCAALSPTPTSYGKLHIFVYFRDLCEMSKFCFQTGGSIRHEMQLLETWMQKDDQCWEQRLKSGEKFISNLHEFM